LIEADLSGDGGLALVLPDLSGMADGSDRGGP